MDVLIRRLSLCWGVFSVAITAIVSSQCPAQDDFDGVVKSLQGESHFFVYITVDADGRPTSNVSTKAPFIFESREVRFLKDHDIQVELGIDDLETIRWIFDQSVKLDAHEKRIFARYFAAKQADRNALLEESRELPEKIRSDAEGRFDSDTLRRLEQLRNRHRLLDGGLTLALMDSEIAEELKLDDAAANRLREQIPRIREQVEQQTRELLKKQKRAALEALAPQQREWLKNMPVDPVEAVTPSVELALWQARHAQSDGRRYEDALDELCEYGVFHVSPGGQLEVAPRYGPTVAEEMIETATVEKEAFVLAEQVAEFRELADDPTKIESFYKKFPPIHRDLLSGKLEYKAAEDKVREVGMEIERWRWGLFVGTLLPHQKPQLEALVIRRSIAQRGLCAALTNGRLGNLLKLTNRQRAEVRRVAGDSAAELINKSRELEDFVRKELAKNLSPAQSARLNEIIGGPPKKIPGAPSLLLMDVRSTGALGLERVEADIAESPD